jgi:TolA-binding protein
MYFLYSKSSGATKVFALSSSDYAKLSDDYFKSEKSMREEGINVIATASYEKLLLKYSEFLGQSVEKVSSINELK